MLFKWEPCDQVQQSAHAGEGAEEQPTTSRPAPHPRAEKATSCLTNVNYDVLFSACFAPRVAQSANAISTTPMK